MMLPPVTSAPLAADEAEAAFGAMLDGRLAADDIAQFLVALSDRGETASEIAGAARAMRARMIPVAAPTNAIDVCGTGGDGHHTLNVSTAVSLVVAACGVPVVDTLGVRGGAIHSPDEFLIVPSLAERAALSALVLHRLATGASL